MIQSFTHPTHGPLTVGALTGRSYICTKEDGTEVKISSKEINKLTRPAPLAGDILGAARAHLEAMEDGPVRVQTAKDLWHLADRYLQS